ncbi:MAG TPA: tetratricopeptide repeat protein [Burkholderiales bacterium]
MPPERSTSIPTDERLRRALDLRDSGRLTEAESQLRTALAESPEAEVHFQLAILLQMQDRLAAAETNYRMAIAGLPSHAEAYNGLGVVLHRLGRDEESLAAHERALSLRPGFVDASNNAAVALQILGRMEDAVGHYAHALALAPAHPGLHFNRAAALEALGRFDEAEAGYRRALELAPDLALAHNNLGASMRRQGRVEAALEHFLRAIELQPDFAQARLNLAYALIELGRFEEGLAELDRYLADRPEDANALVQRGRALELLGRFPEAKECYLRTLELSPGLAEGYMRLGGVQRHVGDHDEGIANLRRAVDLAPDSVQNWTGLLFALNYADGIAPSEIYTAHREFGRRFSPALVRNDHANAPEPERRLRVGYVSGDFRTHAVAQFIEPVLENHDRDTVEVFCYYTLNRGDAVTDRLKRHAAWWREVHALSDDAFADRVRADGIDVLIDLSGHTAHNRLLAFARKPAPVQATWLGYLNTTGLPAMDWRITDRHAAPAGLLEAYHSEGLMRLPHCQWCYREPEGAPGITERSPTVTGPVVFAAFTNPSKITGKVIGLWVKLLARVPDAKLLLLGQGVDSIAAEFRAHFARHGITPERISLQGSKSFPEYLALHGEVDIMLDTFPYTGGTTSCHGLWMGVPLVTLTGETSTSRGGASLLNTIGLPDLVADSAERYLEIAENLANDPIRLKELRAGLRGRMLASPLMDIPRFTRDLEQAFRFMWRSWCEQQR